MADQLAFLEARIAAMERVVFGPSSEQKEIQPTAKVVDKLVAINNKLSQTVSSNEKVPFNSFLTVGF